MEAEKKLEYQQKLAGLLDTLFTKTISGTSISPKELEQYNNQVRKITSLFIEIADQVALERCKKLNDAILTGFTKMEVYNNKRFRKLENKEDLK